MSAGSAAGHYTITLSCKFAGMPGIEQLILFSWVFIGVLALLIAIPYLRGNSDLLTTWNLFLMGSINFVGLGGLKAGYAPDHFRIFNYSNADYEYFILGVLAFFIPLVIAYHAIRFPRKLAGKTFRRWPPATPSVLFLMLGLAMVFSIGSVFPIPITGVRQIMSQVGNKAIVFGVVLAFAAWYRQRTNPILAGTLIFVMLFALVLSIKSGGGRRTVLGVAMAIPIAYYWLGLRYRRPLFTLTAAGISGLAVIMLISAYSQVRHFDRRGDAKERSITNSFNALMQIPSKLLQSDVDELAGQNAVQCSLAAIYLYTTTKALEPAPFHTAIFVTTIAYPRDFWPDKPVGLGYSLPKETPAHTRATWGPGIVGHGYHEGGVHMLVFYAVIVAIALRYADELLVRQSDNPYLLGAFAASAGHIIGWTRGDIGTFTIQILTSFLAGYILGLIGRFVFGSGVVYPRTDDPIYVRHNLFGQSGSINRPMLSPNQNQAHPAY